MQSLSPQDNPSNEIPLDVSEQQNNIQPDQKFVLAGFWRRAVAVMIDYIVVMMLLSLFIVGLSWFGIAQGWHLHGAQMQGVLLISQLVGALLIIWAYGVFMESKGLHATVGKALLGLQVVNQNQQPIGFKQANVRFFGKILSTLFVFLGFIWAAFHRKKQTWHDLLAKTYVILKEA